MSQEKTQSQSLNELVEAADLVRMIEDLTTPANLENLTSASWSGMRITLRNIRTAILTSHATLANEFINRSKGSIQAKAAAVQSKDTANGQQTAGTPFTRKDLKASLERYIE